MKAETLKKSILQYAMEGKLVEQNPNDESASELLKRIKAEKEQLIKEGKIKKEKPLPSITDDEIPYELPQGWEWVRLGDICKLSQGIKVDNVKLPLLNAKYLRTRLEKQIYTEGIIVKKDDYIILVDGENSGEVFKAFEDGILGSTFKLLEINKNIHLSYILSILKFYQDVFRGSKKGAAIPHLDKNLFKSIIIGLPPLEEQKRIVEKLEQILPLVDKYGKDEELLSEMNKKLPKQIRQSILQYAVQGKLVEQNSNDEPASELLKRIKQEKEELIKEGKIKKEKPLPLISEDEIPYDLPQGWEWVRLGEIVSTLGDGIHGTPIYTPNTSYYFINGNNLNEKIEIKDNTKTVSEEEYLKYKKELNNRTVLVSINGTLGNVAFYNNETIMLGKSACYFNLLDKIDKMYIHHLIKSDYFIKYADKNATGTTIKNVSLKAMRDFFVPLPPLEEQKRIVAKVDELMKIVDKLEM